MSRAGLPCVSFREAYFIPTFSKWQVALPPAWHCMQRDIAWQGNITAGISAYVDDASCLDSLPLGITRTPPALPHHTFNNLLASSRSRGLAAGAPPVQALSPTFPKFLHPQAPESFAWLADDFDIHMGTNATRLDLQRGASPVE
jgi:hypothetical protein